MKKVYLPVLAFFPRKNLLAGAIFSTSFFFGQQIDSLKEKKIEEVIVVGYGTQKKAKISGAVSEVNLDKLSSRSLSGVGAALQGKSPGVVVMNEGGDPTSTPRVNIRGLGGVNGEIPLYVIDGVVFDGTPTINPNDIESISVLKDASAAIYGARSSGGVILITTKRGKKGQLSVEFDAKMGIQNAWKIRRSLNAKELQDVISQAYANVDKSSSLPDAFNSAKFPDGGISRTNWMDEIFRTGDLQEYNVNITGGGEKSKLFLGMNHRSMNGTLINTQAKRYSFRINSEHEVRDWLKIGENMSYTFSDGNSADTSSGYTGAILAAMYYPSNVPVYDINGNYSGLPLQVAGGYGDMINPVAYLERISSKKPTHQLLINPYVELTLLEGLKYKSNFSQTFTLSTSKDFTNRVLEVGKIFDFNRLVQQSRSFSSSLAEQILTYHKSFNRHNFDATLGYTYQKSIDEGFLAKGEDFKNESQYYQYLTNANANKEVDSYKISQSLVSVLGRLNYDYDGRYIVSLLGRRDGSSLVAQQNRFENYYAVSGAWMVSKESFFPKTDWLNQFKLRGSYGVLGNLGGISSQAVNPLMQRDSNVIFGQDPAQNVGYFANVYPNKDLKWGSSEQTDYGLDLGFLNNRVSVQADYFIKDSKNQIFQVPLPSTAGYEYTYINAGLFRDKGYEIGISFRNKNEAKLNYSFTANVSHLVNKVLEMPVQEIALGTNVRGVLKPSRIVVGDPLYSFYGLKTGGLFQSQDEINNYKDGNGKLIQPDAKPGDIKFLKKDGNNGNINSNDFVNLGNPYPKFSYSFSYNMNWKNFDLNVFFQGVYGNEIFNGLKYITLNPGGTGQNYNMDREILNAWTPQNTNTNIPRLAIGDPTSNYSRVSDFYVENGSYLRLKNLTLGYSLPESLYQKLNVNNIRIYVTADNLVTFTKYTGFDPEVGMDNNGVDMGRYPQARSFIFGVSVKL